MTLSGGKATHVSTYNSLVSSSKETAEAWVGFKRERGLWRVTRDCRGEILPLQAKPRKCRCLKPCGITSLLPRSAETLEESKLGSGFPGKLRK